MIVFRQESYDIVGAAFEVYNDLGPGFLEAVYQEAFEMELKNRGIPFEREKELKILYKGVKLEQTYRADFVCYDKIIVELKAVNELDDSHRAQVYNYLHATGFKLGLLLNFGNKNELQHERIVLWTYDVIIDDHWGIKATNYDGERPRITRIYTNGYKWSRKNTKIREDSLDSWLKIQVERPRITRIYTNGYKWSRKNTKIREDSLDSWFIPSVLLF